MRVSFAGGGTDIPAYYRSESFGAVVSATIQQYMYIVIHPYFNEKIRIKYSKTEDVSDVSEIEHPIVRECLRKVNIHTGLEIASFADVPSGTGLGSSSAFTVGLLNALYSYRGTTVTKDQLAAEACEIEIDILGEPIGKQDQYAVASGGLNCIQFFSDETVDVQPINITSEQRQHLEKSLLLYYVGGSRKAKQILEDVDKSISDGENKQLFHNIREQAEEVKTVLCSGDVDLGDTLARGWKLKKAMSPNVTNNTVDKIFQTAFHLGCTGGKLLGAGSSGFVLLEHENHSELSKALGLRTLPVKFDTNGSTVIFSDSNI